LTLASALASVFTTLPLAAAPLRAAALPLRAAALPAIQRLPPAFSRLFGYTALAAGFFPAFRLYSACRRLFPGFSALRAAACRRARPRFTACRRDSALAAADLGVQRRLLFNTKISVT